MRTSIDPVLGSKNPEIKLLFNIGIPKELKTIAAIYSLGVSPR
jgi:hypothetical protein